MAFSVKFDGKKIGICTDLGFVTKLVEAQLMDCDWLYLESNHEEEMVHACSRPPLYKQRVLGRQGHISNKAAAELIRKVYSKKLKHVYLAHLSGECNSHEVALKVVSEILEKDDIKVPLSVALPGGPSHRTLFYEEDIAEESQLDIDSVSDSVKGEEET